MKFAGAISVALFVLCGAVGGEQQREKPPAQATRPAASAFDRIAKDADAARKADRIDEAIGLYKRGVALKPSWEEGWWFLGTLYYKLDDYTQGRDAFRHLTAINQKSSFGWAMLGLCEFQTKQYDRALAHLRRGVDMGLNEDQDIADVANYHLALLLTRFEEYEQALKVLAPFSQRNLAQPDFVEAVGIAALRKPVLPSELPPTDRQLVMDVGRVMYDAMAERANQTSAEFKILLDKYPDQPAIHYLYGSFLMFSDASQALEEFKREPPGSPSYVPAMVTIAAEYLRTQEYKAALPYAEKAVAVDPQSFAAHAVLGRTLVEGDLDQSRGISELEQARKLEPNSPQVRIALATAYARAGRKDDATRERQEFQKLKRLKDDSKTGSQ